MYIYIHTQIGIGRMDIWEYGFGECWIYPQKYNISTYIYILYNYNTINNNNNNNNINIIMDYLCSEFGAGFFPNHCFSIGGLSRFLDNMG
jgi:hypothetical protein